MIEDLNHIDNRSAEAESEVALAPEAQEAHGDGMGCHAGADQMMAAAKKAGKSEILGQYAKDYPQGPHDQPQSMCPAFGSLRVGLRMKRTATILSGSACCVYGLTFTSHFYGARRTVGYVPFDSESLVTGKLYEDIRDAVHEMADPANYDCIVVTSLCVPTASGVPLQMLPKSIDGVRIVGIDVPGFGIPTHAEAKDVLAGAMLKYARDEVQAGPVPAPENKSESGKPRITMLGEMFPADPMGIGAMLEPMGLEAGTVVPIKRLLVLRQSVLRELRLGFVILVKAAMSAKLIFLKPRICSCQQSRKFWRQRQSTGALRFQVMKVLNCLSHAS